MLSPRVKNAVNKASIKLGLKGLVVFCAIVLNGLLTQLVQLIIGQESYISKIVFALVLHSLSSITPFILHFRHVSGDFALEMLTEMCAWAWVAVIDSVLFESGQFMLTVSIFFVVLSFGVPVLVILTRFLREDIFHTSVEVRQKLSELDLGVCAYSLGFVINAFYEALVYRCIFKGGKSAHSSYGLYVFMVELSIATRILYKLETMESEGSMKSVVSTTISVFDSSLAVAIAFAWIGQFRNLFNWLVFTSVGEDIPETDDAAWLEEEEEDEGGGLTINQVGYVWLWFAIFLIISFAIFVFNTIQLNRKPGQLSSSYQKCKAQLCCRTGEEDPIKKATKRRRAELLLEAIALAIGFAAEKSLGESLVSGLGESSTLSIILRAGIASLVVMGLVFQQNIAKKGQKGSKTELSTENNLQEQLLEEEEEASSSSESESEGSDSQVDRESQDQFSPVSTLSEVKEPTRASSEVRGRNEDSGEWL